jgi:tRNA/tmRNA/rRNA uracil-C5-methylase (TrmA/RlmC/RlmD family)
VVRVDRCLIAHPEAREAVVEPSTVVELVETTTLGSHHFTVAGDGFWQVHPGAPRILVETVMSMLARARGERALDLYAGVGLFCAFLADAVGPAGAVTAVEGNRRATGLARQNLAGLGQVSVVRDRVDRAVRRLGADRGADVVVLDPPRAGAKRQVVRAVAGLAPRAVAYVACDPAALARDLGYFAEAGYRLADLRAFDLFPMTHHVECVALVVPR